MTSTMAGHNPYVVIPSRETCPGSCGRVLINESTAQWSDCQACPWGTKKMDRIHCNECTSFLSEYDICFFVFHALLPFIVNRLCIHVYSSPYVSSKLRLTQKWVFLQFFCSFLESFLALLLAMISFKPVGELAVFKCHSSYLYEWYPMIYNPVINFTRTMRCTTELVYPLFSMPYVIAGYNLILFVILRSSLYCFAMFKSSKALPSFPYYAILWTLPVIIVFHTLFSGVFYFTYPYICLFTSLTLTALHLASNGHRNIVPVLKEVISGLDHVMTLFLNMALFGFSLYTIYISVPVSYYRASTSSVLTTIGFCVPLPTLFYIFTIRLTTPPRPPQRYAGF